jgi:hypothetical protein
MAEKTADPLVGRHLFERPLPYCPSCEAMDLVPISRDDGVDYVCRRCAGRWHVELGAFWRVDVSSVHEEDGVTT